MYIASHGDDLFVFGRCSEGFEAPKLNIYGEPLQQCKTGLNRVRGWRMEPVVINGWRCSPNMLSGVTDETVISLNKQDVI